MFLVFKGRFNGSIFNDFQANARRNRIHWPTHATAMNFFVRHVVISNIVDRK